MVDFTIRAAWSECTFCSKSKFEIAEIIRDEDRWGELPVQYKCAWKKICQVGFPRFGRKQIWKDLCGYRADTNNSPSPLPYEQSDWLETECIHLRKAKG